MAAIPSAPAPVAGRGILRVVTNQQIEDARRAQEELKKAPEEVISGVAGLIRKRFDQAIRHRRKTGVDDKLMASLRAFNGEYHPEKLARIREFGGSDIYARVTAQKCRAATALLRDVYLSADESWSLRPTPEPTLPESVMKDIEMLAGAEALALSMGGQPPEKAMVDMRKEQLAHAARLAEKRRAERHAAVARTRLDDILLEGRFYEAFSEFLADLPLYQIAVLKGPVVRRTDRIRWQDGKMVATEELGFFWERVSPFDFWTTPGAVSIRHSETFERQRFTVQELYDLIGVPGYDDEALKACIEQYDTKGFKEWTTFFEHEREKIEHRDTEGSDTGLIDAVEFNGYILGKHLKEIGLKGVTEDIKPYFVTAWLIDRHVIKVMLNPNPRKRVPYYLTSFDKRSGSIYGDAIPQLLEDIQDVVNAALRALVNNLSIASGPQVAVNEEMINPTQGDSLYPWKVWKFSVDPAAPNAQPITFFQPQSNASELLGVFKAFGEMADEASAIPRYMTGDNRVGGAGRTASGLQMLMGNANKALQSVAQNVDEDIVQPILEGLYDIVMLTDTTGLLRGDESIVVNGVRNVAKQEQDRVRQLEFLQLTANPIDAPLIGAERAVLLQKVADRLGVEIDIPEPGETPPQQPPAAGGASFNPAGGAAPDGAVSDANQPRLASAPQVNNVSARQNVA